MRYLSRLLLASIVVTLPVEAFADCIKARLAGGRVRLSTVDTATCRAGQVAVPDGRLLSKTVLPISGEQDLLTIDGTFYNATGSLGTFEKLEADSTLRVTLNGHGALSNDGDSSAYCTFQVRINGNDSSGSPSTTPISGVAATATIGQGNMPSTTTGFAGATATGFFDNIAAGTHDVSVWINGVSVNYCRLNSGGFVNSVVIEEID